jgi:hypothetical protein
MGFAEVLPGDCRNCHLRAGWLHGHHVPRYGRDIGSLLDVLCRDVVNSMRQLLLRGVSAERIVGCLALAVVSEVPSPTGAQSQLNRIAHA